MNKEDKEMKKELKKSCRIKNHYIKISCISIHQNELRKKLRKQFHLQEHQNKTIIYSEITLSKKVKH